MVKCTDGQRFLGLKYQSFLKVSIRLSTQRVLKRFGYQANLSSERDSCIDSWEHNIQKQIQILSRDLPVANIARSIFVNWTPSSTSNSIHILIAFGRIFSKINPSSKHAAYIGMSLIKAFVNDCIHKRGA